MSFEKKIKEKLEYIYPFNHQIQDQMIALVNDYKARITRQVEPLSEKSVYLITYGDAFYEDEKPTLQTLHTFLNKFAHDTISDVHLLPMFEYTSDDGFSVVDYHKIATNLGDWKDVSRLSKDYRVMFDFVANHISQSSEWFQSYLNDEDKYRHYFVEYDDCFDYTNVTRPRTSDLFHSYRNNKKVWTTFSEDQVDLNFACPEVLLEMSKILLDYVENNASSIRLDAIGFIWKESATTCMHHPKAHAIIALWRIILEEVQPNCQIITETNVPHIENISYFGENGEEANMVYQFALPPLVLYSFVSSNATALTKWAKTIENVDESHTYFNFLSSHDGIGLRATEGILKDEERDLLVQQVIKNGGRISYKSNPDKTQSVYEMNINYHDALVNEDDTLAMQIAEIKAVNSILLSVMGIPAIYYHSFIGSRNDVEGFESSGINRRINRQKFSLDTITDLLHRDERRKQIYDSLQELIRLRKTISAFNPYAKQEVLEIDESVFAITRENESTNDKVTCIVNVTRNPITLKTQITGTDLVSNKKVECAIHLEPFQFMWIRHETK